MYGFCQNRTSDLQSYVNSRGSNTAKSRETCRIFGGCIRGNLNTYAVSSTVIGAVNVAVKNVGGWDLREYMLLFMQTKKKNVSKTNFIHINFGGFK